MTGGICRLKVRDFENSVFHWITLSTKLSNDTNTCILRQILKKENDIFLCLQLGKCLIENGQRFCLLQPKTMILVSLCARKITHLSMQQCNNLAPPWPQRLLISLKYKLSGSSCCVTIWVFGPPITYSRYKNVHSFLDNHDVTCY